MRLKHFGSVCILFLLVFPQVPYLAGASDRREYYNILPTEDWSNPMFLEDWQRQQAKLGKSIGLTDYFKYLEQHAWIGKKLVEKFDREGMGDCFVLEVDANTLESEQLHAANGARALYHPRHRFNRTVIISGTSQPDKYKIEAIVAGIAPTGEPTLYNLPFGPGCVYKITGQVRILGTTFKAPTVSPLYFVVYKDRRFVHVRGAGLILTKDGREKKLGVPKP
ncbi:MAG: hypothetical protein H8E44_06405 [Planctomycetes bacterium]|nr:hypothetical protein [Planctomycetota bacterium]MBL7039358.1 hypothetical protein [Pirellulaceae bacterium]